MQSRESSGRAKKRQICKEQRRVFFRWIFCYLSFLICHFFMIVFIIIVFIWSCIPRSMMQSRTFQEIMIYSQWCGLASSMCSASWGCLDNVTGNKAVAWWGNWLPCWWKEQEVPLQVASKWGERILWPFCNVLSGTAGAELSCLKTGLHSELHRRFTVGLLSKGTLKEAATLHALPPDT